jgi:hypothetical protein
MESRAAFKQISEYDLRNAAANSIDTGTIPSNVTSMTTNGPANRGVEVNTNRQVGFAPMIVGITPVEYGASMDAPMVEGFKVQEGL